MANITQLINAPIDVGSALACKEEAIAFIRSPDLTLARKERMRLFIDDCDDVLSGRVLFEDAFPHGAESTFLWLAYG